MHIKRQGAGRRRRADSLSKMVRCAYWEAKELGLAAEDLCEHIALRLGGRYVKTPEGWKKLVAQAAKALPLVVQLQQGRIRQLEGELAVMRKSRAAWIGIKEGAHAA